MKDWHLHMWNLNIPKGYSLSQFNRGVRTCRIIVEFARKFSEFASQFNREVFKPTQQTQSWSFQKCRIIVESRRLSWIKELLDWTGTGSTVAGAPQGLSFQVHPKFNLGLNLVLGSGRLQSEWDRGGAPLTVYFELGQGVLECAEPQQEGTRRFGAKRRAPIFLHTWEEIVFLRQKFSRQGLKECRFDPRTLELTRVLDSEKWAFYLLCRSIVLN